MARITILTTTRTTSALAIALLFHLPRAMAGVITGSPHDFSMTAWSGGEICIACHTPHRAAGTRAEAVPLWSHQESRQTYRLYSSPAMKARMYQPAPMSKLCLSCHDGTIALDSFGGNVGARFISDANNLGTDMNVHHPTSFIYDAQLAASNRGLFNPANRVVTIGGGGQTRTGTVEEVLLYDNRVECSTCHDVHNTYVATNVALMKMTEQGSALCFACHNF
jgi:predicted CXXCH cytochrome family protein